ncbi:MAG: recombinase family protein [Pirellulaceae bacterium]
METAILYLRYSPKPDAAECDTLETQRQQLTAYCTLQNLEPAFVIEDPEVSGGEDLDKRDGGQRLLLLLGHDAARHVLVQRVDRLSRNTRDGLAYIEDWAEAGVGLHLVNQNGCSFDATTPAGHLMLTLLLAFATFERKVIGERTEDAMQRMKREGRRVGRYPRYGYRFSDNNMEIPDDHEQMVVRQVKEMRAAGDSYHAIARRLNGEGVTLPRRSWSKWDSRRVYKILRASRHVVDART